MAGNGEGSKGPAQSLVRRSLQELAVIAGAQHCWCRRCVVRGVGLLFSDTAEMCDFP